MLLLLRTSFSVQLTLDLLCRPGWPQMQIHLFVSQMLGLKSGTTTYVDLLYNPHNRPIIIVLNLGGQLCKNNCKSVTSKCTADFFFFSRFVRLGFRDGFELTVQPIQAGLKFSNSPSTMSKRHLRAGNSGALCIHDRSSKPAQSAH